MLWTGLAAGFLTLPALNAGTDMGCLPPPPPSQDYLKKTVRAEIKGQLVQSPHENDGSDRRYAQLDIAFINVWQIKASGKTYLLDFGPRIEYAKDRLRPLIALPPWNDLYDKAEKLVNKTVIVTGTLDGKLVHVTGLTADDEYVKETTEVEVRGQLQMLYTRFPNTLTNKIEIDLAQVNILVNGQTYHLEAAPGITFDESLADKTVVLTGVLSKNTITVKTLKVAE
jgi:hypothetical protein